MNLVRWASAAACAPRSRRTEASPRRRPDKINRSEVGKPEIFRCARSASSAGRHRRIPTHVGLRMARVRYQERMSGRSCMRRPIVHRNRNRAAVRCRFLSPSRRADYLLRNRPRRPPPFLPLQRHERCFPRPYAWTPRHLPRRPRRARRSGTTAAGDWRASCGDGLHHEFSAPAITCAKNACQLFASIGGSAGGNAFEMVLRTRHIGAIAIALLCTRTDQLKRRAPFKQYELVIPAKAGTQRLDRRSCLPSEVQWPGGSAVARSAFQQPNGWP